MQPQDLITPPTDQPQQPQANKFAAHKAQKILIAGASGTGKTTYACRFILGCEDQWIFVYDHMGQIANRIGIPALTTFDSLHKALQDKQRVIIFDPVVEFQGMTDAGLDFFCDWVFSVSKCLDGVKLFVCDEIQKIVETDDVGLELSCVVETGRNYGLDCMFVSLAPNLIHNRIRGLATEVVAFRLIDDNALKYVEGLGFNSDDLRRLPRGTYIALNTDTSAFTKGTVFNANQVDKTVKTAAKFTAKENAAEKVVGNTADHTTATADETHDK